MKNIKNNNKKGITLVALVVVIIVLLILAGAIIINLRKSRTINSANEATFKSDLQSIKDAYKIKYDDLLYQYRGQKDKITKEDLQDLVPQQYKPDFIVLPEGPAYIGEDPEVKEIAKEMEYIIGIPEDKLEIEYVNLDSTSDTITVEIGLKESTLGIKNIEYYISEDGENWTKIDSTELTNIFTDLKESTEYKIKVVVIDENDGVDESDIYKVKTKAKDFEAGEVELTKGSEDGEKYQDGEWTNESIFIKLIEDGLNTTYEVYGANEVEKGTTTGTLITNSGISKIRVTTEKNGVTKSREYEVKIDKDGSEIISLTSNNTKPTNQNIMITAKAIDRLSGIVSYMFSEDGNLDANSEGWESIDRTNNIITKEKEIEQNGTYYFYVKDLAGNISKKEIVITNIDKTPPTLNGINVTAPASGTYKAGQQITIEAVYSEAIKGNIPVLKIKFGDGIERILTAGTIQENKIIYNYTITDGDNGKLITTSYSGSITDLVGNILNVSNKSIGGNEIIADTTVPTNIAPTLSATTNSITAIFRQTDDISGINNATIEYAIKKATDSSWGTWIADSNLTHTFTNLIMNTEYEIKTRVSDNVGNTAESQISRITTKNITKPTLSAPTAWTNQNVAVTILYPEIVGTTRQYSTDGNNWSNATELTQTVSIGTNNTTVYARIIDSTNQTSGNATYKVTNIDKDIPTVAIGTNGGTYTVPVGSTTINISTTLTATDTGGSALNVLQYQLSTSTTLPADSDPNWKIFTNGATVTESKSGGTYYLYTKVTDTAGNRATSIQKSNAYNVRYQVRYDVNGGSGVITEQVKVHGTNLTLSSTVPTRTGYTFQGWNTDKSATTAQYASGGTYSQNASVLLYAIWKKSTFKVTYNYSENGGTSSSKTTDLIISGNNIDLTPTATKDGYTFVGWNTNKDATTGLTTLVMQTSDVTLYAIYRKTIVGTFYYYDGTNSASKTVTGYAYNKNTTTTITSPVIANISKDSLNYTQRGWSTGTNAGGTISVNSGDRVTLSSNITYYASYKTTITANFYYSGNKVATSSSGRYLNYKGEYTYTYITIPSSVTSSTGASGTSYSHVSTTKTGSSVNPTTRTTNYYAIYKKTVTVTKYVYNNSSSTATGTAYEYYDKTKSNASINLGTHSLTGYTFRGWSTSSAGNATINVSSNNSASVFNNTTYYGSYSYTAKLTYDLNGGTGNQPSEQNVTCYMNYVGTKTKGSITLSTTKPTWSGYVFTAWYASKEENTYDVIGSTYDIDKNTTIYAHWQQKPSVKYQAHVQDYGWMSFVSNGSTAGTVGENKALETFKVVPYYSLAKWRKNVDIVYRAYGANGVYYPSSQGYNMSEFYASDSTEHIEQCGVTGQSLKLTGIIITFNSTEITNLFDIWYRVHVEDYGFLPWTKNGNIAGYIGDTNQKKIEAFEVVITLKGGRNPAGSTNYTVGNQYEKIVTTVTPPTHTCNTNGYCNVVHTVSTSYNYSTFKCSDNSHGNHTQYRHPMCTVCGRINQSSFKFKCPSSPAGTQMVCPSPSA